MRTGMSVRKMLNHYLITISIFAQVDSSKSVVPVCCRYEIHSLKHTAGLQQTCKQIITGLFTSGVRTGYCKFLE